MVEIFAETQFQSVTERIAALHQAMPPQTRLIAVTKKVPVSLMRAAYAAGIRDFGESRIQEAIAKQQELTDLSDITWHFLGHLQSNKAKQALHHFQWIHSVDSFALAQRLNLLATELNCMPHLCLQVKLRPDPDKFGWTPTEIFQHLESLHALQHIHIQGLMTILPLNLSESEQLQTFQDTAQLAQTLRRHPQFPLPITELSMGMSEDYGLALQSGATMVRLGKILFH